MRWTLLALAALLLVPAAAAQQPIYVLASEGGPCCNLKEPGEAVELQMVLQRTCPTVAYRLPATVARLSAEAEHFTIQVPAELELPEQLCPTTISQKVPFTARLLATEQTPREKSLRGILRAEVDASLWEAGVKVEHQVAAALLAPPVAEPTAEADVLASTNQASPGAGVLLLAGLAVAAFAVSRRRAPGQG